MEKDWEVYRDTGVLGSYRPERSILRRTEDGAVESNFRDTVTWADANRVTRQREMLIGSRRFCITSVFPAEPSATATDKLLAYIDAELKKEAHRARDSHRLVAVGAVYLPYRTGLPHRKGGYNGKPKTTIHHSLWAAQSGG